MSASPCRNSRPRLDIFDGLRGHLLVGMLVAHLGFHKGLEWLHDFHHNRIISMYDAEFFVLISGLLVGYLWVSTYKSKEALLQFVKNRISTIYRYYVLSALPFFTAKVIGGGSVLASLLGVITMQSGGLFSDILPIYFICFFLLYFLLALPGNRSVVLIPVASAVIYAASQLTNLDGFFGFSGAFVGFDIAAWQFLFMCSIILGRHALGIYEYIRSADALAVIAAFAILLVAFLVLRINNTYPSLVGNSSLLTGDGPRTELHPIYLMKIFVLQQSQRSFW